MRRASAGPRTRWSVMAVPIMLPIPISPAAARPALPCPRFLEEDSRVGCPTGCIRRGGASTISRACLRSSRYISCMTSDLDALVDLPSPYGLGEDDVRSANHSGRESRQDSVVRQHHKNRTAHPREARYG